MKDELRKEYKLIRKNIINKKQKDKEIYKQIITNNDVLNSTTILLYASLKDEVDTFNIIKFFINKKTIALPKIENNIMNFYIINSIKDLKKGYYNILEPTTNNKIENLDNSIMIVPGICFSKDGYRIGYGKGYYDKYLENKNIKTIGICYKECLINKINNDNFDIKIDKIITSK